MIAWQGEGIWTTPEPVVYTVYFMNINTISMHSRHACTKLYMKGQSNNFYFMNVNTVLILPKRVHKGSAKKLYFMNTNKVSNMCLKGKPTRLILEMYG